jgi:phage baseplate assembly protein W
MYTNLNSTSKSKSLFRDFLFSFKKHPGTNQLLTVTDEAAISQSVKNIVLTNHYEKPFDPFFGGNVIAQLFENFSPAYIDSIRYDIKNAILKSEPRVDTVTQVDIYDDSDRNAIGITIYFTPINSTAIIQVDAFIERLR